MTKGTQPGFRNIFLLGLVSFFTDLSSEMIYPLIPVLLTSLGVSKSAIGLVEGIAESTGALLRTMFGRWSDKVGKRKLFVYLGYLLSGVSKPFLYFAGGWPTVLAVRFSDRVGKAMRTPARDALISTSVSDSERGKAFGLQRAMDTLGAVGGPLLALLVLHLFQKSPNSLRLVFLFSFLPAGVALIFLYFVREPPIASGGKGRSERSGLREPAFLIFLSSAIIFSLGTPSNAFLVLRAQEAGLLVGMAPLIWMVHNITSAVSSPIFGVISDKIGRKSIIVLSFLYYSTVHVLFGLASSVEAMWALFAVYGIYHGLSEGALRAYIADLVVPERRGTAYGLFNTGVGLALIPASIIFGAIWDKFGSQWAFFTSAGFSFAGFLVFAISLAISRRKP